MFANTSLFSLSETYNLKPEAIRIDGDTQSRAGLNLKTVAEYAELMRTGVKFPPVVAFFDNSHFWLVDGFHRLAAVRKAGLPYIEVQIGSFGTQRDARLHSAGVNGDHGLQRTNADKRHAVLMLLQDEEWGSWSDSAIAKACGVSHPFVGKVRAEIFPTCNGYKSDHKSEQRKGLDGRTLKIANIGKASAQSEFDNQAKGLGLSTSRVQVLPSMENYSDPTNVEDFSASPLSIVSQPSQSRDRIENDFYPTNALLTKKLLAHVEITGQIIEPCAGDGAIARELPYGCITNDLYPRAEYQ